MATDVILTLNGEKYYDISFTSDGDIATASTFDTFLLICLFEEKRASESEIPNAKLRRGWIGNTHTPGFEQGSKLWLYEQERVTISMLSELATVLREAMQPLLDEGHAKNVEVPIPVYNNGIVTASIRITRFSSDVETFFFELWNNTPNGS